MDPQISILTGEFGFKHLPIKLPPLNYWINNWISKSSTIVVHNGTILVCGIPIVWQQFRKISQNKIQIFKTDFAKSWLQNFAKIIWPFIGQKRVQMTVNLTESLDIFHNLFLVLQNCRIKHICTFGWRIISQLAKSSGPSKTVLLQ